MIVEVGVRGFIASSIHQEFLKLSIQRQQVSALCNKPSGTAAKCSYAIYLAANYKLWDETILFCALL